MLKIKKSLFRLPHFDTSTVKPMQLSPVTADSDELSLAVATDPDTHDNNWELADRPDEAELEAFWNNVEADVKKDPKWFTFDE